MGYQPIIVPHEFPFQYIVSDTTDILIWRLWHKIVSGNESA